MELLPPNKLILIEPPLERHGIGFAPLSLDPYLSFHKWVPERWAAKSVCWSSSLRIARKTAIIVPDITFAYNGSGGIGRVFRRWLLSKGEEATPVPVSLCWCHFHHSTCSIRISRELPESTADGFSWTHHDLTTTDNKSKDITKLLLGF